LTASFKQNSGAGLNNPMPPLLLTGTPQELDAHFVEQMANFKPVVAGFQSNLQEVAAQIEARANEAREKAKAKATAACGGVHPAKAEKDLKTERIKGGMDKAQHLILSNPGSPEFTETMGKASLATLKAAWMENGDERLAMEIKVLALKTPEELGLKVKPQAGLFFSAPAAAPPATSAEPEPTPASQLRTCRSCGCTEDDAADSGCRFAEGDDLCATCANDNGED
jgi:PRTRC genetic system protein E